MLNDASTEVVIDDNPFSGDLVGPQQAFTEAEGIDNAVGPLEDGLNPILITSSNSGVGWRSLVQSGPQPYYPRAIDVSKRDASTIYAFNNRMWVSGDAGECPAYC